MRRLLLACLAPALLAAAAGPAAAALSLQPGAVPLLTPPPAAEDRAPVYAARAGTRYRFEVAYRVAGAARIGTGHVFAFEDAITGERLEVLSKSFPPEPAGRYTESSELRIPQSWTPGLYRFRWTITARNPRLASVRATGTRVFLVLGASG
jgi:hypothetical protein